MYAYISVSQFNCLSYGTLDGMDDLSQDIYFI